MGRFYCPQSCKALFKVFSLCFVSQQSTNERANESDRQMKVMMSDGRRAVPFPRMEGLSRKKLSRHSKRSSESFTVMCPNWSKGYDYTNAQLYI